MMRINFINGGCPCGKTYDNIKNVKQYNKMRELHLKKCETCKNFNGEAVLKTSLEKVLVKMNGEFKRTSIVSNIITEMTTNIPTI